MIIAAVILGLAGSLHCVGMCGPLSMAVPGLYGSTINKWIGAFIYHSGRALTYAGFGLIFGSVGKSLSLAGMQTRISVVAGIIMIVMGLIPIFQNAFEKFFAKILASLKIHTLRGKLLKNRQSPLSILLLGSLNGLLPCGLVYVALTGAIGTGNPVKGAVFMFFFGLGTLPALYVLSVGGRYALSIRGFDAGKVISSVTVAVGLLFILRGADLGIPFISPNKEALTVREVPVEHKEPAGSCCISSDSKKDKQSHCH